MPPLPALPSTIPAPNSLIPAPLISKGFPRGEFIPPSPPLLWHLVQHSPPPPGGVWGCGGGRGPPGAPPAPGGGGGGAPPTTPNPPGGGGGGGGPPPSTSEPIWATRRGALGGRDGGDPLSRIRGSLGRSRDRPNGPFLGLRKELDCVWCARLLRSDGVAAAGCLLIAH